MSAIFQTPNNSPRPRRIWRWLLIGSCIIVATGALMVFNLLTLTRDAAVLRDELVSGMAQSAHSRIQLSVGPMALGAVRTGLNFVKDLPEEAKFVMKAVRKASVGVYGFDANLTNSERMRMLSAAEKVMARRGWIQTVTVDSKDALVLVYLPESASAGSSQRVCVAVFNDKKLVVVSGTLQMQPLVDFALAHQRVARR